LEACFAKQGQGVLLNDGFSSRQNWKKNTHTYTLVCAGGTDNLLKSLEKKLEDDHQHISPLPSFLELQAHACLSVLNTDIIIKKLLTHLLCPKVRFTSQFLQLVIE
jgi:hypothetical protein